MNDFSLSVTIIRAIGWVRDNREKALYAAGGAAALIALVVYFALHYQSVNASAWNKLAYAQGYSYNGMHDQALKMLDEALATTRSGELTAHIRLARANVLYDMKNYKDAAAAYEGLAGASKSRKLVPFAHIGLGNALENMKDFPGALKAYTDLINVFPENYLVPLAYDSAGRVLEFTGSLEQAKQTYEKLSTLYPNTVWQRKAQEKVNYLISAMVNQKGK